MRVLIAIGVLLLTPAAAAAEATLPAQVAVAEDAGEATVTVTLDAPSPTTERVPWRTASAGRYIADAPIATAGTEYTSRSGELEFPPGETEAEIAVPIADDQVDDPSPFFAVELPDPDDADRVLDFGLVLIDDDDPTPPASAAGIEVAEGQGSALVPVSRAAISRLGHAAYRFAPVAGTAVPGEDFDGAAGRMSIGYGMLSGVARVAIVDDKRNEPAETFQLQIAPDAGPFPSFSSFFPGPVAGAVATVTVTDDDAVPAPPTIVTVRRLSGTVKLRGKALTTPTRALKRHKVDARRGSARLVVTRGGRTLRSATVTGGAVRVLSTTALALTSDKATIRSTGLSLRGDEVVTAPATTGARWTVEEVRRGTRVTVRGGRVKAGGATLRAGRPRTFR